MKRKQKLFNKIMYYVWSFEFNKDISYTTTYEEYLTFLERSEHHFGDCTHMPNTCSRCLMQHIEITAQNLLNDLLDKEGYDENYN